MQDVILAVLQVRPGTWTMLALAGGSLSALIGGLLVAVAILMVWAYSGSKAHAPTTSPPHSDDSSSSENEDSESGVVR